MMPDLLQRFLYIFIPKIPFSVRLIKLPENYYTINCAIWQTLIEWIYNLAQQFSHQAVRAGKAYPHAFSTGEAELRALRKDRE